MLVQGAWWETVNSSSQLLPSVVYRAVHIGEYNESVVPSNSLSLRWLPIAAGMSQEGYYPFFE